MPLQAPNSQPLRRQRQRARARVLFSRSIISFGWRASESAPSISFPVRSTLSTTPLARKGKSSTLAQRKHCECVFQFGPVPVGRSEFSHAPSFSFRLTGKIPSALYAGDTLFLHAISSPSPSSFSLSFDERRGTKLQKEIRDACKDCFSEKCPRIDSLRVLLKLSSVKDDLRLSRMSIASMEKQIDETAICGKFI